MNIGSARPALTFAFTLLVTSVWLTLPRPVFAQATVGTGSIVGTVSDPTGAVIRGAEIAIANAATRQVIDLVTNSSGSFNSGAR